MNGLKHWLITRFSYRGREAFRPIDGPTFLSEADPLDPKRLDLRFRLFETTCLPGVLGQTEQNFSWVLVVDRALPARYLQRLESLVATRPLTRIVAFDPALSLAHLGWLGESPLSDGYAMTTNLDDDDCIPRTFIAAAQRHISDRQSRSLLPPVGIIGAKRALEWDLVSSEAAPLGWRAPWHRGPWVLSVGLSLYCRAPPFDLCVLGLRHAVADSYLDFSRPPVNRNVQWFRRAVMDAAIANGLDMRAWQARDSFYDLSEEVGEVLLANHGGNDQSTRLHESKAGRVPINGAQDLAEFAIDWQKAVQLLASSPRHG